MPKSTKKTSTDTSDATEVATAMAAMMPIATMSWLEIMNEGANFAMERLQRDLETQKDMLKCKTPAELMKLQSEFYQRAMKDYAEEAARLFEMMSKATTSSLKEVKSSHARKYDDVPL